MWRRSFQDFSVIRFKKFAKCRGKWAKPHCKQADIAKNSYDILITITEIPTYQKTIEILIWIGIITRHKTLIPAALYFDTGIGNHRRILDVNKIHLTLGRDLCDAIIGFHAFTGKQDLGFVQICLNFTSNMHLKLHTRFGCPTPIDMTSTNIHI